MKPSYFFVFPILLWLSLFSCEGDVSMDEAIDWANQSFQYYRNGDYSKAIELSEQVLEVCPYYGESFGCIGLSYYHLGQVDKAIPNLLRAIEFQPYHVGALKLLCVLPYDSKKMFDYLNYCSRCINIDENFVPGYEKLIPALYELGEKRKVKALIRKLGMIDQNAASKLELQFSYK